MEPFVIRLADGSRIELRPKDRNAFTAQWFTDADVPGTSNTFSVDVPSVLELVPDERVGDLRGWLELLLMPRDTPSAALWDAVQAHAAGDTARMESAVDLVRARIAFAVAAERLLAVVDEKHPLVDAEVVDLDDDVACVLHVPSWAGSLRLRGDGVVADGVRLALLDGAETVTVSFE